MLARVQLRRKASPHMVIARPMCPLRSRVTSHTKESRGTDILAAQATSILSFRIELKHIPCRLREKTFGSAVVRRRLVGGSLAASTHGSRWTCRRSRQLHGCLTRHFAPTCALLVRVEAVAHTSKMSSCKEKWCRRVGFFSLVASSARLS
mmetsp:Transcript_12501/g.38210  ORF Transcript_12501/g.38210 Transcript_12501/m.38210 type:complete len:150 (-) Transcript_12501:271-720(-)